ncbi:MAG: Iron complex transport system substrate-binding protein [Gemmatimonadetes bacterium]|nr:Iron complex transport system substrate-binding protein [Gemmatimonadota bacterium]
MSVPAASPFLPLIGKGRAFLHSTAARPAAPHAANASASTARARFAASIAAAIASAVLAAACGTAEGPAKSQASSDRGSADGAVSAVDAAGRSVRLSHPARRIVSLIPSATETLVEIGAGDRLVGRTDFDHGPAVDRLPSVGGGMTPSLEALVSLKPDLVLGWETSKDQRIRERLGEMGIPVFAVKAEDTTDVFRTVRSLGMLTARTRTADSLLGALRTELAAVRASVAGKRAPSVFFLVWNDPPMTAGPRTFISQLLGIAGGRNVFTDAATDWPNVSMEEIVRRDPDILVLPQGEKGGAHDVRALRGEPGWRELRALREGHVVIVPADLVNRPGPHLAQAARLLRDGLHPDAARP